MKRRGFRCLAEANITQAAQKHRPTQASSTIPSLVDFAPMEDFAQRAYHAHSALQSGAIEIWAWRWQKHS